MTAEKTPAGRAGKARRQRLRRARQAARRRAPCPTPHKRAHPTQGSAIRQALSLAKSKNPARVYHCPCGLYHVTQWTLEDYQRKGNR